MNIRINEIKEEGLHPRRKNCWRRTPPESPSPLPSSGGIATYLVAVITKKLKIYFCNFTPLPE